MLFMAVGVVRRIFLRVYETFCYLHVRVGDVDCRAVVLKERPSVCTVPVATQTLVEVEIPVLFS